MVTKTLTAEEIALLNTMCPVAQRTELGDFLNEVQTLLAAVPGIATASEALILGAFKQIDWDHVGTATRPLDFQSVPGAGMTSGVDKQLMYVRADLDRAWAEDVSGGDGYTVLMARGYIGASAGGMIAEGFRAGINLDAGVIVSDPAGAGYISGGRLTTYVPIDANAKCNKGVIIAPRDDSDLAAIAGSQYIGAQIYLAQHVAKLESFGLDVYTEPGCATMDAGINVRNGSTEVFTHILDMNGCSPPGIADIRFSNALVLVALDTAITAGATDTTTPAGSLGITSHGTGVGHLFVSDGAHWQYAAVA